MSFAAIIRELIAAGVTGDALCDAIARIEQSMKPARASGAERQARYRERKKVEASAQAEASRVTSRDVSDVSDACDVTNVTDCYFSDDASRARSLCEDSNNIPPVILTDDIPQGGKREKRARRIPSDWNPSQRDIEFAIGLGLTPAELATARDEFREYWQAEGSAKARKLDWDLAFRGRLRFIASKRKLSPNARAGPRSREPDPYSQFFLEMHGLTNEQHRETFGFGGDSGSAGVVIENGT